MTTSFQRILMGPGPSNVSDSVIRALSQPTVGHLDPDFIAIMDEIKTLQQYAFQSESPWTFTVSAPGSAGMEAVMFNLIEPGDRVLICQNGVFGTRLLEMAKRAGAETRCLMFDWGTAVEPAAVDQELAGWPGVKLVAFVHAETSTGVCSDARAIAEVCRSHNALSVVDTVTSLGGVPLHVDQWGLDAVYSGSQKCLSCVPGLSPLVISDKAWHVIQNRSRPVQSWFLDLTLLAGYWGGEGRRAYHHTAPVNALYAWHQALTELKQETLQASWNRHRYHHGALRTGLETMGLEYIVAPEAQLPQLNPVSIPEGVDDQQVRSQLLDQAALEIGAGLGDWAGKVWRIGLMGHTCNRDNVETLLAEIGPLIGQSDKGVNAAQSWYQSNPQ